MTERMHSAGSVQDNKDIVVCGELRAYRVMHYELNTSGVFAQIGTSDPWIFRPFTEDDVTDIFALNERHLLVRGKRHAMAVADVVERSIMFDPSTDPDLSSVLQGTIVPSAVGDCFLWTCTPWKLISTTTLRVIHAFDGTRATSQVVRRQDGSFAVVGMVPSPETSNAVQRIVIVHPDGRIIIQDPLDERGNPVPEADCDGTLSPCGRWAVRAYTGSVSLHGHELFSGGGTGISRFFRPKSKVKSGPHYTLRQLEGARIDQLVELWSVEPLRLLRRIKIGESTIEDLTKQKLTRESPFATERLESAAREFECATDDVTREPLATRYNELAAASLAWNWGCEALHVLSQAADLRSFKETRLGDPPLESLLKSDKSLSHWLSSLRRLQAQYFWAPDSTAISVLMSGMLHRADLLGAHRSVEPWVIPKFPQPPDSVAAAVRTMLERELEVTVPLDGLDAISCAAAIDRMRGRLADGIGPLMHKGTLRFRFDLGNRIVAEPEFFAHVCSFSDQASPEPRAALAKFWQAFSALPRSYAAPIGYASYSEDAGGLAYAATAFAELEPMAFVWLKRWFEFRWPEREGHGRTKILPAIDRVNAWASREAVSFGLWAVAKEELYGPHFVMHKIAQSVLHAARRQFTARQMAAEVAVIMQSFADGVPIDDAKYCLRTLLYPRGPGDDLWDRQLARELGM